MKLSEPELRRWGRRIGQTLVPPAVISLSGPLGAGKSVLARAIGEGAGVRELMPSPTYTLLQRYAADRCELVHLDLYRIERPDELWELGWAQLPGASDLVLIEWPERAGPLLPQDHWLIRLTTLLDRPDLRGVEVVRVGAPPALELFASSLTRA